MKIGKFSWKETYLERDQGCAGGVAPGEGIFLSLGQEICDFEPLKPLFNAFVVFQTI